MINRNSQWVPVRDPHRGSARAIHRSASRDAPVRHVRVLRYRRKPNRTVSYQSWLSPNDRLFLPLRFDAVVVWPRVVFNFRTDTDSMRRHDTAIGYPYYMGICTFRREREDEPSGHFNDPADSFSYYPVVLRGPCTWNRTGLSTSCASLPGWWKSAPRARTGGSMLVRQAEHGVLSRPCLARFHGARLLTK